MGKDIENKPCYKDILIYNAEPTGLVVFIGLSIRCEHQEINSQRVRMGTGNLECI